MEYARRFVADFGVTFTMLWSDTFAVWRHYEVMTSSDFWLLDSTGNRVGDAPAAYDPVLVEQLLSGLRT
ncbi:MAG: hypothetical protein OXI26_12400 [bacterium]|nr:hypothetical protein [bacterium]